MTGGDAALSALTAARRAGQPATCGSRKGQALGLPESRTRAFVSQGPSSDKAC